MILVNVKKTAPDRFNNSPDAEFMEHCEKVDHNPPETWSKYPQTTEGANGIITMEYNELTQAIKSKSDSEYLTNLYHLSVACLHAWRIYGRSHTADK